MNEWNFFFVEYGSNLARLYLKVGMGSKRDSSYSNVHISQRKKSLPQKKKNHGNQIFWQACNSQQFDTIQKKRVSSNCFQGNPSELTKRKIKQNQIKEIGRTKK